MKKVYHCIVFLAPKGENSQGKDSYVVKNSRINRLGNLCYSTYYHRNLRGFVRWGRVNIFKQSLKWGIPWLWVFSLRRIISPSPFSLPSYHDILFGSRSSYSSAFPNFHCILHSGVCIYCLLFIKYLLSSSTYLILTTTKRGKDITIFICRRKRESLRVAQVCITMKW